MSFFLLYSISHLTREITRGISHLKSDPGSADSPYCLPNVIRILLSTRSSDRANSLVFSSKNLSSTFFQSFGRDWTWLPEFLNDFLSFATRPRTDRETQELQNLTNESPEALAKLNSKLLNTYLLPAGICNVFKYFYILHIQFLAFAFHKTFCREECKPVACLSMQLRFYPLVIYHYQLRYVYRFVGNDKNWVSWWQCRKIFDRRFIIERFKSANKLLRLLALTVKKKRRTAQGSCYS